MARVAKKTKTISLVSVVAAATGIALALSSSAAAAQPTVGLGSTANYAVLAGSGITNTGSTTVSGTAGGDLGSSPTGTFTGDTGVTTTGTKFTAVNAQTTAAKVVTAYDDAAVRTPVNTVTADLGGQTLTAGVYNSASSLGLTGTLTLDAENNPDAVFIFQAGSTLITETSSTVALIRGAQPCNVFWQVGSSATFKTTSNFTGHVFALESITAQNNATFHGQLLARNGEVTLESNTIVNDACSTVVPTETASASASPTTTNGGGLPNTDSPDLSTPLFVGFALALVGSVVLFIRRKKLS
jgi:type VI secretion system secreted protein VgrG